MEALIEARNLKKHFDSPKGKVHAVDDVSFKIMPGRTMGVVGEQIHSGADDDPSSAEHGGLDLLRGKRRDKGEG